MASSNTNNTPPVRFGWKSRTWTQLLCEHGGSDQKTATAATTTTNNNNNNEKKDGSARSSTGFHPDTPLCVATNAAMRENAIALVRDVVTDEEATDIIKASVELHEETVQYEMARLSQAVDLYAFERSSKDVLGVLSFDQQQAMIWRHLMDSVTRRQAQIAARVGPYTAAENAHLAGIHRLERKLLGVLFFGLCRQEERRAARSAVIRCGPMKGATAANMDECCLLEAWNWQVETLRWFVSWLGMKTAEVRMNH